MSDDKYDALRAHIATAEKPLDLRDKIALEVLNGIIANSKDNNDTTKDLLFYLTYDLDTVVGDDREAKKQKEYAAKRFERLIRGCYRVADIMRKVRLSTFE